MARAFALAASGSAAIAGLSSTFHGVKKVSAALNASSVSKNFCPITAGVSRRRGRTNQMEYRKRCAFIVVFLERSDFDINPVPNVAVEEIRM